MNDLYIAITILSIVLIYSLGFETISIIAVSLVFLVPIAGLFPTALISYITGIQIYYSIIIVLLLAFILGYFLIDYPYSEEFHNDLYVDRVNWSNKTLEEFKSSNFKTEGMINWIGDGKPIEVPMKISKLKESLNRLNYYLRYVILEHAIIFYNHLLWQYGRGGSVNYYSGRYAHSLLNNRKPQDMCEDIAALANAINSIKVFKDSYCVSLIAYFLLISIISDFSDDGFFIYSLKSIFALIILSFIFQKFLRRYADDNNVKFNLFKKYQDAFAKHSKQIGFTYINIETDKNSTSLMKLSVRAVNPKKNSDRTTFVHSDRWHDYFVVPYGIGFSTFHKLLPFIKDIDEHIRFIKVIKESELK